MTHPISMLFVEASSNCPIRVVTHLSLYAGWGRYAGFGENAVNWWAAAISAFRHPEEIDPSTVATLLLIASDDRLLPYIPDHIWAWLRKRPSLPPICEGRKEGTKDHVVRRIRELGDVEILESYFLLVWSEWDSIYWNNSLSEMHTSIREDLGGIGMWRNRGVLIERLYHVLGQLDRGLKYLKRQNPSLGEYQIQSAREQYGALKELLLEVDRKASETLTRTPFKLINLFNLLTPANFHRIPLDVHLCPPSPMPVVAPSSATLSLRSLKFVPLSHMGPPAFTPSSSIDRCPTLQTMCLLLSSDMRDMLSLIPR